MRIFNNWSVLTEQDETLFQPYFNRPGLEHSYENNWLFVLQEMRNGAFKYCDGNNLVIAASKYDESPFIFVFPPWGTFDTFACKVNSIAQHLASVTGKQVVFRKVSEDRVGLLRANARLSTVAPSRFTNPRDIPEDTYPQVIIDIHDSIQCHGSHFVKIRNHVRFFKEHYHPTFADLTGENLDEVVYAIKGWQQQYELRKANETDNNPDIPKVDVTAYTCLAEKFSSRTDAVDYYSVVLYALGQPVGFALAGRTSGEDAALYCSVCKTGIRGGAESLHLRMLDRLSNGGIRYLNLGGAENEGLHNFKKKFAVHRMRATFDLMWV